MNRDEIREAISDLERQKPTNVEMFEFREAELKRLLDKLS